MGEWEKHLVRHGTHTFNPGTEKQRPADFCEFKDSLVYRVSSRTVRAIYIYTVSNNNNNTHNRAGGEGGKQVGI